MKINAIQNHYNSNVKTIRSRNTSNNVIPPVDQEDKEDKVSFSRMADKNIKQI